MRRRSFLNLAGSVGACSIFGEPAVSGGESMSDNDPRNVAVPIDHDIIRARNQNRSTVVCANGIVCSSHPLASLAGVDMLRAGGNAVDAAVTANAMLSLVAPMMCGPGGDLFAIVWIERDRKLYGLNASGRAPYDWNLEEASARGLKEIPPLSPLAWSVPGCVSGWDALLERFGSAPLKDVLAAPVRYAREGFPVPPVFAREWTFAPDEHQDLARTFMPDGRALRFGDMFRNPDLADFFELLSRDGAGALYRGDIAERIVAYSQKHGGRFSLRDFHDHTATWIDPVSTTYRGYDVWELPPNCQGIAALEMLNILEHFDIPALENNSAEHLHLYIEAKKLAFEDRAVYYADMDFAEVPLHRLISREYGRKRAQLIDPNKASRTVSPGAPADLSETVYLTTADDQGNMVSLIQSISWAWGSRYVPEGLGFCLQNRGAMFSLDPASRNRLEPHKRPFHTIIPSFVSKDDRPVFSFGVMHGDYQPQGQVQILMNILDHGMSPQQAGEQSRTQHIESSTPMGTKMTGGGMVVFERHIPDRVKQQLADRGHVIKPGGSVFGGYQGIWRQSNPRRYFGGSDSRKDGCAIGY